MNEVTLENYRCFRERQSVRLAPLTLLVGDNSTGKTSFLALIRALWDAAFGNRLPDFKESPYDLGSFDEIVSSGSAEDDSVLTFKAGFRAEAPRTRSRKQRNPHATKFTVYFVKKGSAPFAAVRRLEGSGYWVGDSVKSDWHALQVGKTLWTSSPHVRSPPRRSDRGRAVPTILLRLDATPRATKSQCISRISFAPINRSGRNSRHRSTASVVAQACSTAFA